MSESENKNFKQNEKNELDVRDDPSDMETEIQANSTDDDDDAESLGEPLPTAAAVRSDSGKVTRKRRAGKTLTPSSIFRMCRMPSASNRKPIDSLAELMYANSEYASYSESEMGDNLPSTSVQPQRRRTNAKKEKLLKKKRKTKRSMMKSLLSFYPSDAAYRVKSRLRNKKKTNKAVRKCLCTEIDGKIYKLMDFPLGVDDVQSMRRYFRTQPKSAIRRALKYLKFK